MKTGSLYYNKENDTLIGNERNTAKALGVDVKKLHKVRYERQGGGWAIDLDDLAQPVIINSIVDEDGDEIAKSVGELCRLEDLFTEVVLKRLRRVEGQPTVRRFIEEPIMGKKKPISWKYRIEDEWGDHLCDDVEQLVEITGVPLDLIYYHLKEKTKGDDSVWVFYEREVE